MSPALETWRRRADSAELDLLIGNGFHFAEHPNESNAPRVLLDRQPWDEVISGVDWIIRAVTAREWPHRAWLQLVNSELVRRLGARFIEGMGIRTSYGLCNLHLRHGEWVLFAIHYTAIA
jgi:hypothetical protein